MMHSLQEVAAAQGECLVEFGFEGVDNENE
jgi:hypothetical protein